MKKQEWNEGMNHLDPDIIEKYIEKKDRTEEISTIQYNNAKIIHPVPNKNTQPLNYKYTSDINNKYDNNFDKDFLELSFQSFYYSLCLGASNNSL